MNFEDFIDIYFADKEHELKERTINSKKYMINRHIIPFLRVGRLMKYRQVI